MARSQILAIDAGGTMTDTFIIDENGEFVVGKAQTTPNDEHIGLLNSARDALSQWNAKIEEEFPNLLAGVYSGTAMLNRLVSRVGKRVGLIVNKGMEDNHRMGRGCSHFLAIPMLTGFTLIHIILILPLFPGSGQSE